MKKNPKAAIYGLIGSGILLAVFVAVHAQHKELLAVPTPFLIVALVPIAIGLIMGGYITSIRTPIVSIDSPVSRDLEALPRAPQKQHTVAEPGITGWQHARAEEYQRTHGYMLAHVYRPSMESGQKFDIYIFVVRHRKGTAGPPRRNFTEIQKAEFFFGDSWGNETFPITNTGGIIGVQTHAYGTFLATCRVTFTDPNKQAIILHRYVDFEMAPKAA